MKKRVLAGVLCLGMLFGMGVMGTSVYVSASDIEANAQANAQAKERIEKAEADANINMVADEIDDVSIEENARADASVDPVEDGSQASGMYTVVYRDGRDGNVFKDVTYQVEKNKNTPVYTPDEGVYPGYEFDGWSPSLSQKVSQSQIYTANWKKTDEDIDVDAATDDVGSDVVSDNAESASENEIKRDVASVNRGTSQSINNSDLENNGKEDAFADDVDSGDIPVGLMIVGVGACMFALAGVVCLFRKANK